ncbi:unnamed protein product [Rhizophagus irregularis]|nr:unnamed protein product [Rhizophagus irregularis]
MTHFIIVFQPVYPQSILQFFDHLASETIILRFFGHLNFGDIVVNLHIFRLLKSIQMDPLGYPDNLQSVTTDIQIVFY